MDLTQFECVLILPLTDNQFKALRPALEPLLGAAEVVKRSRKKKSGVTWDGERFHVAQPVFEQLCGEFPCIQNIAIAREITKCGDYHAEKGTKIKAPKASINTWLKNAFEKYGVPSQKQMSMPRPFNQSDATGQAVEDKLRGRTTADTPK